MAINLTIDGIASMTPDERKEALRYMKNSRFARHNSNYTDLVTVLEATESTETVSIKIGGRTLVINPGADGVTGTADDMFTWQD